MSLRPVRRYIAPLLHQGLMEPGDWRLVATSANRQPTAATTFNAELFPAFGLPPTLD